MIITTNIIAKQKKTNKLPSSITILCQIRSKGQDGGFISGLASYAIEPEESKVFPL